MFSPFVDLLLLILIANGSPVVARNLFRGHLDQPMDFGYLLPDQRPVLGPSKTWRGFLFSLLFTSLLAFIMGYPLETGFQVALFSLLGDSLSSFIKRRLGKPSSSRFLLLDQVPESLFPALVTAKSFNLSLSDVLFLVAIFIMAEQLLSRLMFNLGVRKKPY